MKHLWKNGAKARKCKGCGLKQIERKRRSGRSHTGWATDVISIGLDGFEYTAGTAPACDRSIINAAKEAAQAKKIAKRAATSAVRAKRTKRKAKAA